MVAITAAGTDVALSIASLVVFKNCFFAVVVAAVVVVVDDVVVVAAAFKAKN